MAASTDFHRENHWELHLVRSLERYFIMKMDR
jgi:hypothetical protein